MNKVIIIGVILVIIGIGVTVGMNSDSSPQIQNNETIQPVEEIENNPEGGRNLSLDLIDSVVLAEP